jgi:uncharacterized protein YggE
MIKVTGHAQREIEPSGGRWSIVAEEERPDPSAAFEDCAARANAIVESVEPVIGDGRLSTGPVTVRARRRDYDGPVVAHRAVARIEVVAGLEDAGAIAEAAMRAGATGLNGPAPDYPDEAAVRPALLREAVAEARTKAEAIAAEAGRKLGAVVSVSEPRHDEVIYARAASMEAAGDGEGPPVRPGPRTVSATVRVHFELAPR